MLEGLKKLPLLGKALTRGQERAGELAAKLMTDERLVASVQAALSTASKVRHELEERLRRAMQSWNVARADEIQELRDRIAQLERTLDQLSEKQSRRSGNGPGGEQQH